MIPEKVLIRYAGVKALEQRGVAGEKETATRIAHELRAKYPGIDHAAKRFSHDSAERKEGDKYWWPGQEQHPQTGGNWERIFAYAQDFWGAAASFAETVSEAARGAALASEVKITSRVSKAGNLLVGFSMPMDVYKRAIHLNDIQQVAFRHRLHEALSEELDVLFEEKE